MHNFSQSVSTDLNVLEQVSRPHNLKSPLDTSLFLTSWHARHPLPSSSFRGITIRDRRWVGHNNRSLFVSESGSPEFVTYTQEADGSWQFGSKWFRNVNSINVLLDNNVHMRRLSEKIRETRYSNIFHTICCYIFLSFLYSEWLYRRLKCI